MKKELGITVNMEDVKAILLQSLKESFGFRVL
jgi:hypothetical protein